MKIKAKKAVPAPKAPTAPKAAPAPWSVISVADIPVGDRMSQRTKVLLARVNQLEKGQCIVIPKEYVIERKSSWGVVHTLAGKLTIDRHLEKRGLCSKTRYDRETETMYLFIVEKKKKYEAETDKVEDEVDKEEEYNEDEEEEDEEEEDEEDEE